MKKLLLAVLCIALPIFAQSIPSTATGSFGASSADCSANASCVSLRLLDSWSTVTVNVSGTFSATGTFELSNDSGTGTTWTAMNCQNVNTGVFSTTVTAAGTYQCDVAGGTNFRVRPSGWVSGTMVVALAEGRGGPDGGQSTIVGALPAGTNVIGKVTTDQTTHGTTDLVATDAIKVNGNTMLAGNGVTGTGSQRVTVASDNTPFQVKVLGNAGAVFDGAVNVAAPANAVQMGCAYLAANGGSGGNLVPPTCLSNNNTQYTNSAYNTLAANAFAYAYDGTGWSAPVIAKSLDAGASNVLAAHQVLGNSLNGTFTSIDALANQGVRQVSSTNSANTIALDTRNLVQALSIHSACSAGTAAVTVTVSVDNSNFLTIDSITAAQFIAKVYGASTAGASAASASAGPLAPLSFRYITVSTATCGVGNTSTLTVSVKGS